MNYRKQQIYNILSVLLCFCISCKEVKTPAENKITAEKVSAIEAVDLHIKYLLVQLQDGTPQGDSLQLPHQKALINYYIKAAYSPVWSNNEKWNSLSDSLLNYLDTAIRDGLFKEDYQYNRLISLKRSLDDSVLKMDRRKWAEADLLFTSSFLHILQDLRQGRLQHDSLSMLNDTISNGNFFNSSIQTILKEQLLTGVINQVQPSHYGYKKLKEGIKGFADSMDNKVYTYLIFPFKKGRSDSLVFTKKLILRLRESGFTTNGPLDSSAISGVIKRYQGSKKIAADGKISATLIRILNNTDLEKFKRVAVTLDRFKQLPDQMPGKYIWVNIPAYKLEVWEKDSVVLESKVICGKTNTPTPNITSAISDLVIYPTWTVPQSIIAKEMLPGLKKNPGYLAKKGLSLINNKGEMIDPATVSWEKYSKGIPYRILQESGDRNALGVIKFNFSNPYAVYLHDTNQRYLFKNASRALSHGCVRVQDWEKLAHYILRNDSIQMNKNDSLVKDIDSIKTWIVNKERHRISVKYQFPLFIRYFGCEAVNGTIKFYDDIYGADKILRERFFSQKKI